MSSECPPYKLSFDRHGNVIVFLANATHVKSLDLVVSMMEQGPGGTIYVRFAYPDITNISANLVGGGKFKFHRTFEKTGCLILEHKLHVPGSENRPDRTPAPPSNIGGASIAVTDGNRVAFVQERARVAGSTESKVEDKRPGLKFPSRGQRVGETLLETAVRAACGEMGLDHREIKKIFALGAYHKIRKGQGDAHFYFGALVSKETLDKLAATQDPEILDVHLLTLDEVSKRLEEEGEAFFFRGQLLFIGALVRKQPCLQKNEDTVFFTTNTLW